MKKALITGISGQDGSYLADFLLSKGYEVHGLVRRVALEDPDHRLMRIQHVRNRIHLHAGSLENYASVAKIIGRINPDECYHLAAQSFVTYSFEDEFSTWSTNTNGTMHVLSALKEIAPKCKFYFAGSSEMFGQVAETPQKETTRFHPRSPYGVSKAAGFYMTQNYREAHDMFACNGILFNHESPRRGFEFVTRKISSAVAKIKLNLAKELRLGNLEAKRDWGYAPEYVEGMWMMLQQERPDDYVLATGETHSIKEFVVAAFEHVGLDWEKYVAIDKNLYRPSEVHLLLGDYSKAKKALGWTPKMKFTDLVKNMVKADLDSLGNGSKLA